VSYLDRYLLRAVLGPMILAFGVLSFLGLASQLNERSSLLISQVLTLWDIVRLAFYMLPYLVPIVLPLAVFFGILSGFGKLAGRGEITAMRAAGMSLWRLIAPVLLFALWTTLVCVIVQDAVHPYSIRRAYRVITTELPQRATADTLGPGVVHTIGDWRVYFAFSDRRKREIYDVAIVKFEPGRAPAVFHAESARVEGDELGQTIVLGPSHGVTSDGVRIATDNTRLPLPLIQINPGGRADWDTMRLSGLLARERESSAAYASSPLFVDAILLRKIRSEIARRLSEPFAAVGLACVAAPMVIELSRGRTTVRLRIFAYGLILVMGFYVLQVVLRPAALVPLSRAIAFAWIPNMALMAIGAMMYWRVSRVH
jgi:lipopolysaccharide export LptBFGC system permease protein LptF